MIARGLLPSMLAMLERNGIPIDRVTEVTQRHVHQEGVTHIVVTFLALAEDDES